MGYNLGESDSKLFVQNSQVFQKVSRKPVTQGQRVLRFTDYHSDQEKFRGDMLRDFEEKVHILLMRFS